MYKEEEAPVEEAPVEELISFVNSQRAHQRGCFRKMTREDVDYGLLAWCGRGHTYT